MRTDEFDLPMADGVAVHVRRWLPDDEDLGPTHAPASR